MAADLLASKPMGYQGIPASQLVSWLCMEAGVCILDSEFARMEIHEAHWDVINGLIVKDRHGNRYRLCVNAVTIPRASNKP